MIRKKSGRNGPSASCFSSFSCYFKSFWQTCKNTRKNTFPHQSHARTKFVKIIPAMSLFLYLNFLALHSRIPSMMEAWFNSSLKTASSGLKRASNKPVFASKQQAYRIASSRSWNLDIFSSSSLWISCNIKNRLLFTSHRIRVIISVPRGLLT